MKCKRCKHNNSYKANYCFKCGREFRKLEKDDAINTGFVAFLKRVREEYDTITLSHIMGTWQFKIISILVVLAIGIFGMVKNGMHLKILKSDNYFFQYNDVSDEYYVYTSDDETKLSLYSIGNNQSIKVSYFNNDELLSENVFDNFSNIILSSQSSDNYYILDYKNESLKVYIYKTND